MMALYNIFNEPRREITETAVGAVVVAAALAAILFVDYYLFGLHAKDGMFIQVMAAGFFAVIAAIAALTFFSLVFHTIGEGVCDALQRRGVHLRPRERQTAQNEKIPDPFPFTAAYNEWDRMYIYNGRYIAKHNAGDG